jgi:hypothetical protein
LAVNSSTVAGREVNAGRSSSTGIHLFIRLDLSNDGRALARRRKSERGRKTLQRDDQRRQVAGGQKRILRDVEHDMARRKVLS